MKKFMTHLIIVLLIIFGTTVGAALAAPSIEDISVGSVVTSDGCDTWPAWMQALFC